MLVATDLSTPPGIAAREVAQALCSLGQAACSVVASTPDLQVRNAMLECTGCIMDKANNLLEEAWKAVAKPGDPESQQHLAQVGKPWCPPPAHGKGMGLAGGQ